MESRTTQDARREFAALLEDVLRGQHIEITRYERPLAVIVPVDWYEKAQAVMKQAGLSEFPLPRGTATQNLLRRVHPEAGGEAGDG